MSSRELGLSSRPVRGWSKGWEKSNGAEGSGKVVREMGIRRLIGGDGSAPRSIASDDDEGPAYEKKDVAISFTGDMFEDF